jgi:MFS family permease
MVDSRSRADRGIEAPGPDPPTRDGIERAREPLTGSPSGDGQEGAAGRRTAASADGPARQPSALAPFSSPAYRYLWIGSVITMSGQMMQMVAQGWLVYQLTDSPTWLGIASFARGLPMLVLALPGGVLVDRLERRRLLISMQALAAALAVLLAVLIVTGLIEAWHVVAIGLVSGCVMVLIFPARQALLPSTVERRQLGGAVALASAGQNAGRVVGPSLAGVLISALGVSACFFLQAAGFVVALLCTAKLRPQPVAGQTRRSSAAQNLLEGLRYIRGDRTVFALMSFAAVPCFLAMPYQQLLPIFARDILHAGPEGLGMLMAATGIGSVLGSIGIAIFPIRRQGIALCVSLVIFCGLLAVFAISTSLALSVAIMGLLGVAQAVYMATNNTLLHLAVPDALRGRVMSASMTTWGLMPLGALPQGALADLFGAPIVLAVAGLSCCAFVALLAVRHPGLRRV